MKHVYAVFITLFFAAVVHAQVGIGTASPTSTLDLRGSFSPAYRGFTASTTLTSTDYTSIFTGTSAATVTLPDATTCTGRLYVIKNYSATTPAPALTVATTSTQQIDGYSSWILDVTNEVFAVVSDGANWEVQNLSTPAPGGGSSSGTSWVQGGNTMAGTKSIGTINSYDMPFITSNTERMRITSSGAVGIGSTAFSTHAEALLVYQNNNSYNVIGGKGNLNNYLQLNIQNLNSGSNASSDIVATADNGTETSNYVDMGINSSGYNNGGITAGANNAYLYSQANDFVFGNATSGKNLLFFTTDGNTTAERMRISPAGLVGIGSSSFSASPEALLVYQDSSSSFNVIGGKGSLNNYLQLNIQNKSNGANASSDLVATADNGNENANYVDLGINSSGYNTSSITGGINNAYLYSQANDFVIGNGANNHNLIFYTTASSTGTERMRITSAGKVGINNTSPAATLDVAGTVKVGTAGTVLNSIIRFTGQSITDNTGFTNGQARTETLTLSGVNQYASVIVTPRSALAAGLGIAYAYASAANTVTVVINNTSGSSLSLGTVLFDITVIQ